MNSAKYFLEGLAAQVIEGNVAILKLIGVSWLAVPTARVGHPDGEATGAVAAIREETSWLVVAIAIATLLVAGAKMALGGNGREAREVGRGLGMMVLLSGAGIAFIVALTEIGDLYSTWIVNKAADQDFGGRMTLIVTAANVTGIGAIPVMVMGFLMLVANMTQMLMLVGRSVGLVVLTGLLPIAAAAGISGAGQRMRNRYLTWLLAMLLYKPAAATVYAAMFWLIGEAKGPMDAVMGLAGFCMAVVTLPALMRLIAPAVSSLAVDADGGTSHGQRVANGATDLGRSVRAATGRGSGGKSGNAPHGSDQVAPIRPAARSTSPGVTSAGSRSGSAAGVRSGSVGAGTSAASAGGGGAAAAGGAGAAAAGAAGPVAAVALTAKKAAAVTKDAILAVGSTAATGATGKH